jgi:purine-nucleoside/S-methyl-5'-thioadenosine phosphorylase / adenosine deaminase
VNDREPRWIRPDWPVHERVRALITTRAGGVSGGPWGVPPHGEGGMNVGFLSGDAPELVRENRARLRAWLPSEPRWLKQVHGPAVVRADDVEQPVEADASFTATPGVVAAVMVADCMPVMLADAGGRAVGVAHAGWRGLAAGVVQATARAIRAAIGDSDAELIAYLGPAIGPMHFEVGSEVLDAMKRALPRAADAFRPQGAKFFADLFALGRQALGEAGVTRVHGGSDCTYSDPRRFYSYRRDRVSGRHAALVWLEPDRKHPYPDDRQPSEGRV